jgi:hypothetical protein
VRALAASLCVLLAVPAYAADDAPIMLPAGAVAPVAGVLLPDALAVTQAQRVRACEAERESLKADAGKPNVGLIVLAAVLGVVVGGAAGVAVATAVK